MYIHVLQLQLQICCTHVCVVLCSIICALNSIYYYCIHWPNIMDPALQLNRKSSIETSVDLNHCILCQKVIRGRETLKLGEKGIIRLRDVVKERLQLRDYEHIDIIDRFQKIDSENVLESNTIVYHKSCYGMFTSSSHIERIRTLKQTAEHMDSDAAGPSNEPARVSRQNIPPLDKSLCMFCQTHYTRKRTCMVMEMGVSQQILDESKKDFVMNRRLAGIIDLVAADGRYHLKCKQEFLRKVKHTEPDDDANAHETCLHTVLDAIRCGVARGNVYTLLTVWDRYSQLLADFGVQLGSYKDGKTRFKQKLENHLRGEVDFIPQLDANKPQLLFSTNPATSMMQVLKRREHQTEEMTHEIGLQSINTTEEESNDMIAMHQAAIKLRNDIQSTPSFNNCAGISKVDAAKVVPERLYLFLRFLFTGEDEPTIPDEPATDNSSSIHNKVLSISQDIVFAVSNGRKLTPKHIGLGLTIHQCTRSKALVNLLHTAGHCISYRMLRRVDTTLAAKEIALMKSNDNVPIPVGIRQNRFFQFSADNIDLIEETLNGKGTFHATQMVAFQREQNLPETHVIEIPIGKETTISVADELNELQTVPVVPKRPKPRFQKAVEMLWYEPERSAFNVGDTVDLAWILSRIAGSDDQKVPGWTGFNSIVSTVTAEKTNVGYLPIINAPAHEESTLWTVIDRCIRISEKVNPGQSTVLTLDQQLYCKAKELQWANPHTCASLVVRLGGFHIAMNFMHAIGQHYADSGLEDIWVESGVYGDNTAHNNMSAKSYNKSIRAHKLTYEALWRVMWGLLVDWADENDKHIPEDIMENADNVASAMKDKKDISGMCESVDVLKETVVSSGLKEVLQAFDEDKPVAFTYWRQYMEMVAILLQFIRAEREGNWNLHLASFAAMLPWLAVYDHTNYTRWGAVYLADMKQLSDSHPDVYQEFVKGNFVVKRSKHHFNQISTDQALEHVNKICNVAGGLIGITRIYSAMSRWCLTFNARSKLVEETYEMLDICMEDPDITTINQKQTGPAAVSRDEKDVQKIVAQLLRFEVFKQNRETLISLASHDVATNAITSALMCAETTGKEKLRTFVDQRLSTEAVSLYETLPKTNSLTFKSLYERKATSKTTEKAKVLKADRHLLQRMLVAQVSGRDINITQLMQHELFPVPLSLASTDGKLRPSTKSVLGQILETGVCSDNLPTAGDMKTCTIIDGHALVQAIGKPKGANTFADLADAFIKAVFKHARGTCTRVDVVFDRYDRLSIKCGTRERRLGTGRRSIRRVIQDGDVPLPSNWLEFISMAENKANLAEFLSEEIIRKAQDIDAEIITAGGYADVQHAESSTGRDVASLRANHEEADTRIVLHAVEARTQDFERTVVVCRDTDVLILLVHFRHQLTTEVWFETGTSKKRKYIAVHNINVSIQQAKLLPAFHAITGCDSVSQLSGHAKKSAWGIFQDHMCLLDGLGVGEPCEQTTAKAEAFVCKLYYPSDDTVSCDTLCSKLFMKGKCELDHLPPTSDAVELHIRRAHYQTAVWLSATETIQELYSPVDNGWYESDGELKPLLMRKDAIPTSCVDILTCGCKHCATYRCTCRSHRLKCIGACGCSESGMCRNPLNEDPGSDME